ncbi:ABC transporter ATP-binding protein, partial [Mesotoga sp. UBA5825]|uniref:ABC transporter ATP-binding protein n=1 Tax=Mesotoga sp. UBA5825 TaxID=1946858 RepID=UPI0025FC4F59
MPQKILEVKNLKKYFQISKRQVLKAVDNVSFSIDRGKILGMVGESGCGKTTVGRTIVHLYKPDEGKVLFNGINVHELNNKKYRQVTKKMQMIFQDPYASLDPRKTVSAIVGEGIDIHKLCRTKTERMERIYEMLEMVGLNREHANRFPHEFSGGQRQRIGIARALAVGPEFLVCDEAISALDVSIQAQIINLLIDLQKRLDLTYLFIAHDLSMIRYISDDTVVMYLGSLVEKAQTEELFENPLHPYTLGLLEAVPIADPDYEKSHKHDLLSGEVPSPINPAPGCRFSSRCKF